MAQSWRTGAEPHPPLAGVREACLRQVAQLPADLQGLAEVSAHPVVVSPALGALEEKVNERLDRSRA